MNKLITNETLVYLILHKEHNKFYIKTIFCFIKLEIPPTNTIYEIVLILLAIFVHKKSKLRSLRNVWNMIVGRYCRSSRWLTL